MVMFCEMCIFSPFLFHICLSLNQIILLTMKKNWRKFINSIKPSYKVDVTMYHFIPGMPVKADKTRHSFKKGQFEEAKLFLTRHPRKQEIIMLHLWKLILLEAEEE